MVYPWLIHGLDLMIHGFDLTTVDPWLNYGRAKLVSFDARGTFHPLKLSKLYLIILQDIKIGA